MPVNRVDFYLCSIKYDAIYYDSLPIWETKNIIALKDMQCADVWFYCATSRAQEIANESALDIDSCDECEKMQWENRRKKTNEKKRTHNRIVHTYALWPLHKVILQKIVFRCVPLHFTEAWDIILGHLMILGAKLVGMHFNWAKPPPSVVAATAAMATAVLNTKKKERAQNDYLVSRNLLEDDFQHTILSSLFAIGIWCSLWISIFLPGHCLIYELNHRKQSASIEANTFSEHTELCYGCCFCYATAFSLWFLFWWRCFSSFALAAPCIVVAIGALYYCFDYLIRERNIKWWISICMMIPILISKREQKKSIQHIEMPK